MAIKGLWPNSLKNSTDTPLAVGATFTGDPEAISQTEQPQSVSVSVTADTDSTFDGMKLQFSPDGTNWDVEHKYTVKQGETLVVTRNIELRYFRVVYQTLEAQTEFRLQTRFNMRGAAGVDADEPAAVRIANGSTFVDEEWRTTLLRRIEQHLDTLIKHQKITNLHLKKLTDIDYTEKDTE